MIRLAITLPRNFRCPHTGEPCEKPDCTKKRNGKIACAAFREDRVRSDAAAEGRREAQARAKLYTRSRNSALS